MTEALPPLLITDHALLRWMERVHGVDVEKWRELMGAELDASLASYAGEPSTDAAGFVIVENRVVTVLEATWRRKKGRKDDCIVIPRVPA